MSFSPDYLAKIRQEFDDTVSKTSFWQEFVKALQSMRRDTARSYEARPLDSLANIAQHMQERGELAIYDRLGRLVDRLLERGK